MEIKHDLTKDEIRQYRPSTVPSHFVDINEYKFRKTELYTIAVATCFVPIVFSEEKDFLGLGHFFSDGSSFGNFALFLRDVTQRVKAGDRLWMYLFGGTDGDPYYLNGCRDEVVKKFANSGVESVDMTPHQSGLILPLIIANIKNRTIRCSYRKY